MTKIYLSSTFSDLEEYREAVYHTLRQMRYDVIAMEYYVATDTRPLEKCLQDVAACDLYLGLFAWRYGYIPSEGNPEHKSITELEYRKATQSGKSRLIFLLDKKAPWPPQLMDAVTGEGRRGKSITKLRQELVKEKLVSSFQSPEHLASLVGAAVHLWEEERRPTLDLSTLFAPSRTTQSEQAEREERLKALLADQGGFMKNRLASFVGRQAELAEIRHRIGEKMEIGGYVTITGQAGQGKSSIISKLVEEYGVERVASHFIPLNPGPDHQVGLLRNLMARLILKYDLSDLYVASDNRAALKDFFPKILIEVAKRGQEVIFVDGLDQLEEDVTGIRDLSFLPTNPPAGIVFVLGTRPNDALKPLELLKPRHEYKLPGLSREDFDLILSHRQVHLERELANQFYRTMQENALYLDLVAKELQDKGATSPRELIARIAHNPDNIFSVSMARFKRRPTEWREVLKPVLGVLLAAREPLTLWQIRNILQLEDDRLRDGMAQLGGLIADSEQVRQRRYSLFHLKLQDFLRQDEHQPQKEYIFAIDEEQQWHAVFAAWCEQGNLALIWKDSRDGEQSRREYARRHYVTHLHAARKWQQLFTTLDEGTYGQAKERFDVSTRSYIQDLDLGRQAAAWSGWTMKEGLELLPHLWRYTLLRCSLRSRADQYPLITFQLLLLLNRESEVFGLAELLTDPFHKVRVLLQIARHFTQVGTRHVESMQLFLRAYETARSIEKSSSRASALSELATALAQAQQWERAEEVTHSLETSSSRASALREIAKGLRSNKQELLLGVIQRAWLMAETREYALQLLSLAHGLIVLRPEMSSDFLEAFRWVESFLNG